MRAKVMISTLRLDGSALVSHQPKSSEQRESSATKGDLLTGLIVGGSDEHHDAINNS